jgi:hypothetical protein
MKSSKVFLAGLILSSVITYGQQVPVPIVTDKQEQSAPKPKDEPKVVVKPEDSLEMTPAEKDKLENHTKDLVITQKDFQLTKDQEDKLQAIFKSQSDIVDATIEEIKTAHHWGADVQFNKQTFHFQKIPKAPTKPEEHKK